MKYFGTDGIRTDNMPLLENLTIKTAYALFKLNAKKVFVGYDARPYGKPLVKTLIKNLNLLGIKTYFLGIVPSACTSFLAQKNKADFAVMITASHNPSNVNGIKIFNAKGEKLTTLKEKKIEEFFDELSFDFLQTQIKNYAIKNNIKKQKNCCFNKSEYFKTLAYHTPHLKGKKIVLDCSNGASKKIAKKVFKKSGAKVVAINFGNGKNINQNCGAVYPDQLKNKVQKTKADLGFAFDGDADRCVCVLADGTVLSGDNVLVAIARYYNHSKIVGTIYSNGGIELALQQQNIQFLRSNVGDQEVKKLMNKQKCVFGGERSGHFIFSEIMATGDGLLSALKIAGIENLKQLQHFEKTPSKSINLPTQNQEKLLKQLKNKQSQYSALLNNQGRVMIRPSGTEPAIRILIEHPSKTIIEQIEKLLTKE